MTVNFVVPRARARARGRGGPKFRSVGIDLPLRWKSDRRLSKYREREMFEGSSVLCARACAYVA